MGLTSWLNGSLVAAETDCLSPADRGFTLGDGLFETLRAQGGRVLRLEAHLARLAQGAQVLGFALPAYDLRSALAATLAANACDAGTLRLTLSRGVGARGVLPPRVPTPTVLITLAPLPAKAEPARLTLARRTRRNEMSPLSRIKSLNYLDNIIARMEADERGYDDALLLNTQGRVAESSSANLFLVRAGRLLTPPIAEGALPGVRRAALMARGAEEALLQPEDLLMAEEMFLTTSLGIRPVAVFEHHHLASHLVAERLMAEDFDA